MTFADILDRNVRKYADKELLDFEGERLTYGQLGERVTKTAGMLFSLGVEPGDRVALQLPKCLEFIYLHLANLKLGSVTLPLNTAYPASELEYFLRDSGSRIFFTDHAFRERAEAASSGAPDLKRIVYTGKEGIDSFHALMESAPAADLPSPSRDDDTAAICYTSGTTGRPKGAMITHGNLLANSDALHDAWGWSDRDVLLHALPLFHVHGLFVAFHGVLRAGASAVMVEKFDAERVLALLDDRKCTMFMGVPTMYNRFVRVEYPERFRLQGMRLFISGSAPLSTETFREFERLFTHTILERYGMTEVGMAVSNPLDGKRISGSVGFPLPGVEIRVVKAGTGADGTTVTDAKPGEIGEVLIRGNNVFKGYRGMPDKTREAFTSDGWLKSGDLGHLDDEGRLFLDGRSKELIITGGLNVYPKEVERVLDGHPSVAESAVIGVPDPDFGEKIIAFVVPENGKEVNEIELVEFSRGSLAPYKCPRMIKIIGHLPRNAMGKVQKHMLTEITPAE